MVLFYFSNIASAQFDESISGENITGNITSGIHEGGNQNNSINGSPLSDQNNNIRIILDHIFISKKNNSLEISDIVVFKNDGPEISYSRDNHTFFSISTPTGVKDLKTQAMECCLVTEDGIVYMDPMQPIKPGENFEMQISYTVIPDGKDYMFNKSAVYNTTSLSIFIDKKSGVSIEGPYEVMTLSGNEYRVIAFNDLKAGETVSIPVRITQEPDYLYAGIALFSLFSIGLIYRFRGKIMRRGKKEYLLEELETEKRNIFQTIHGLEKHAGTEKSEEYMKLMEEYRQKAIQIFIKIDKLKNKGISESLQKRMEQTKIEIL